MINSSRRLRLNHRPGGQQLQYTDATPSSGLSRLMASSPLLLRGSPSSVSFFDVDGDGDLDILLTLNGGSLTTGGTPGGATGNIISTRGSGAILVLKNAGKGQFDTEGTKDVGLEGTRGYWRGVSYGDYNADGCVDFR